ncbi:VOC family protein [Catenovulum sp. SX2]|uniref:VOC family protein n=1 Tax=Catenovulum sp. SX2 TaxID=3398614 RepID=UPI003F850865
MANVQVQPYLFFAGRCEEAIEFYIEALDAELQLLMRFNESPEPMPEAMLPDDFDNKIMHASIKVGDSIVMMSDGVDVQNQFGGVSLSISCYSQEQAHKMFDGLAQGGEVQMPLTPTFWSPLFGSLTDKFGVSWMVGCEPESDN